jgi:hypothetical protein
MNRYRYLPVLLLSLLFSIPSYAHHLAVVVPKVNPTGTITSVDLAKIFKSELRKWPDGVTVIVVMSKDSRASLQVVERLCHLSEEATKALIAAHRELFILADSDEAALKLVASTPGALGIVDVHAISGNQVHVVKVDGKLPLELGYLPH